MLRPFRIEIDKKNLNHIVFFFLKRRFLAHFVIVVNQTGVMWLGNSDDIGLPPAHPKGPLLVQVNGIHFVLQTLKPFDCFFKNMSAMLKIGWRKS